jgi:hypothetical protein
LSAQSAVAIDLRVGGGIVRQRRLVVATQFGNDAAGQNLPNSTPHWSKLSIAQIAPWVKTLCS